MKNRSEVIAAMLGVVAGVVLLSVLGAGTVDPNGHFQGLTLGGHTNVVSDDNVDLTYNGAHYQRSVPILNNLTNGIGTNLTSLLASAVQAGQTNVNAANPTATIGATAVNGSAGTFMRSDAAPAIGTNVITGPMIQANTISSSNIVSGGVADTNLASGVSGTGPKLNTSGGTTTNQTLQTATFQSPDNTNPILFKRGTGALVGILSLNLNGDPALLFKDGSGATKMNFDTSGSSYILSSFGINTNAPSQALEVVGNIKASGTADIGGVATAAGFDYNAPATLTPTDAGVSIDFGAANRLATCTLTGAVTFAFANQTAGRRYELFILGAGANANITWPTVSGVFPAGAYPSVAAAGKWHHLKFTCITSSVTTNIYIDGSTSN